MLILLFTKPFICPLKFNLICVISSPHFISKILRLIMFSLYYIHVSLFRLVNKTMGDPIQQHTCKKCHDSFHFFNLVTVFLIHLYSGKLSYFWSGFFGFIGLCYLLCYSSFLFMHCFLFVQ